MSCLVFPLNRFAVLDCGPFVQIRKLKDLRNLLLSSPFAVYLPAALIMAALINFHFLSENTAALLLRLELHSSRLCLFVLCNKGVSQDLEE